MTFRGGGSGYIRYNGCVDVVAPVTNEKNNKSQLLVTSGSFSPARRLDFSFAPLLFDLFGKFKLDF